MSESKLLVIAKECHNCGHKIMSYDTAETIEFCSINCECDYSGLSMDESHQLDAHNYIINDRDEG